MPNAEENQSPISSEAAPEQNEKPPFRELIIGGIGFLVFLTILTLGMNAIGEDNLRRAIEEAGIFAPLLYIAIKAATYIFAPLTSGPIQVIAGKLFGSVELGVLYTLIGEVLGGSISFWIARRFGRPVVLRFVGKKGMEQVEDFYQNRMGGWISLAVARLVLFSLWDFLSYAAGLAQSVSFKAYLAVSIILGFLPTYFFVWLGSQAMENQSNLLWVYGLVALLILLPIAAHKQIAWLLAWASNGKAKG
jgi:uncharacterized membrane protein YdjX (TVP38/TMEM64 family)